MKSNDASVVKCDACGADMVFQPEKHQLVCPYCNSVKNIEKTLPSRRDFMSERNIGDVDASVSVYHCPNCGGDIELDNFATADACPFCGATNIQRLEDMKGLKPDSILPFELSQEMTLKAGKKWLKRRIFAPYRLKKDFVADKFKGIYIPSFAFDSNTNSVYEGRLGERRTRTVGSGDKKRVETYIEWYNVNGSMAQVFDDVIIEASTHIEQKELNKLLPYDISNVESYKKEYLAGFCAERYNAPLDESYEIAKGQMNDTIRKLILEKYNADVVEYLNVRTDFSNIKFNYVMLPLWVCVYKYKEKLYRFVTNGKTGRCTGTTPISPLRVTLAVILGLGIVALLVWLFGFSNLIN